LVLALSKLPDRLFGDDTSDQHSTDDTDGCTQNGLLESGVEIQPKTTFHALLHKVEINACDCDGMTALHVACHKSYTTIVNQLLVMPEIDVNKTDNKQHAPLHAACTSGNKTIVKSLIEHGANFRLKNSDEMHPLHVAVAAKHREVVEMFLTDDRLVEFKTELLQERDKDGNSAFLLAVKSGDEKMVEFLLNSGLVTVTDTNTNGSNAIHLAAKIDNEKIMQVIYENDTESAKGLLNEKDSSGCTPLHYAVEHDTCNALTFLVER